MSYSTGAEQKYIAIIVIVEAGLVFLVISQCSMVVHNTVVRATISQWETPNCGHL